jgi:hypothetical protein
MATKQHNKRSFIPTSGAQAFAQLHDEIAAVREESLIPISVDISFAHQIPYAAADRIDELMPALEKLGFLDLQRVRKLRMYAVACQQAHLIATRPEQNDERLARLLEEGAKLRGDLLLAAELLARLGEVPVDRVVAIRSGTTNEDIADNIEELGALFEEIWDSVESRIPISAEMVERAPGLALELHALLGAKQLGAVAKGTDPQGMRQRAYTLLVNVYEECRSAITYLRRHEGDADSFAPSMFVKKRRRATAVDPPEVEMPETTTPAPTPPLTTVRPLTPSRLGLTELEPTG